MATARIAKIISLLLGPFTWFPILIILIVSRSGLTNNQIYIGLPVLITFQIIVPAVVLETGRRLKKVDSWDLTTREERVPIMFLSTSSFLVSLFLTRFWGNKLLFDLLTIEIFISVAILVITKFWKISLHAAINTAGALIINFLFNWKLPELYLLIPLAIWARLTLKKHTLGQLIAGVLVSGGLALISLIYLGYVGE